jgi:hypothetical protein
MGKLEDFMDKRKAEKRAILKEQKRREQLRREKEFLDRFKHLKTLVQVDCWDDEEQGWKFQYRNRSYWIGYDSNLYWKLKCTNGPRSKWTALLYQQNRELTESVLNALEELEDWF